MYGVARHVIGCHVAEETGVYSALNDVASNIHWTLSRGKTGAAQEEQEVGARRGD